MYKLSNAEFDYYVLLAQKKGEIESQLKELDDQINSYIVNSVVTKNPDADTEKNYEIDFQKREIVAK